MFFKLFIYNFAGKGFDPASKGITKLITDDLRCLAYTWRTVHKAMTVGADQMDLLLAKHAKCFPSCLGAHEEIRIYLHENSRIQKTLPNGRLLQ